MSFANYDIEAQKSISKGKPPPSDSSKSSPASNLDTIIENTSHQIQTYGSLAASFNNEKRLIGGRRDGKPLRDKLTATQQNIVSLGSAIRKLIADINSVMSKPNVDGSDVIVSNRQHIMKDRLMSEFDELEKNFNLSARIYSEKAASTPLLDHKASVEVSESSPLLSQNNGQGDYSQQIQAQEDQDAIEQTELQYHIMLTEERNRQIEQVAEGIREVNSIFKDLGELVNQQGEQLDTVEENVMQMSGNAYDASRELTKAHEYQKRKSKWSCILLVALCVVVLIIVLAVIS